MMLRRWVRSFACGIVMSAVTSAVLAQQEYPSKPIRIIVPFAPGGGSELLVRTIGAKIGEAVGQPVVIDNKPGANGIVAESLTAKAPPDGYTVLLDTTSFVLNPLLNPTLPDYAKELEPVIQPAWVTHVIAANPKFTPTLSTIPDLIAMMKASPGKVSYGSSGTGSTLHLAGELFDNLAGTKSLHVPYKGGAPAITSLLAGDITTVIGTVPLLMPYIKSGQLRALGVTSPARIAELPDTPTVAETLPGYSVDLWWVFLVPVGTPKPVIQRLNKEIAAAVNSADVRQKLLPQGYNFVTGSADDAARYMQAERTKWERVIKSAGIKLD